MALVDLENPLVYGGLMVVVWVLVWSAMEVFLFDGSLLRAVIVGGGGGIAFAVTFTYYQRAGAA